MKLHLPKKINSKNKLTIILQNGAFLHNIRVTYDFILVIETPQGKQGSE